MNLPPPSWSPQDPASDRASSRIKTYAPYVVAAGAALIFAIYLYHNTDQYRQLFSLSADSLLWLVILGVGVMLSNGLTNYLFYRGLGVGLRLNEGVGLAAVNTLANQLPFAGGIAAKSVYLKRRHQLSYVRFLSATLALYVTFVSANGLVGLGVLAYIATFHHVRVPPLLIVGLAAMAAGITILWLPVDAGFLSSKWRHRLANLTEGWHVVGQNRLLLVGLIGVRICITLLFAGRLWIAFHALSQDVTLAQCLLMSSASILTQLVSISPGGVGILEAIVAGIATILGFNPGVSIVAVGIDRLVGTAVILVLGTIYSYVLSREATAVPT